MLRTNVVSRLFVMFTQQCPIFAASLLPVKPYLVNELLNEGYLGHKRLYYGDMTHQHTQDHSIMYAYSTNAY